MHKEKVVSDVTKVTINIGHKISKISSTPEEHKRLMLVQVRKLLDQLHCDYLVVVDGASICHINNDGIIRDLRAKLKEYEISIEEDAEHDWRK
jgi:hypothetical protein